jgi:hypothetical protein
MRFLNHGFAIVSLAISLFAKREGKPCSDLAVNDGQTVTLSGEVQQTTHDLLLKVAECPDRVVLVYADDPSVKNEVTTMHPLHDRNFRDFRHYTESRYQRKGKNICIGCSKYQVRATLSGKLNIAKDPPPGGYKDQLGFLRDESGKMIGVAGFGHPAPIYKYRLIIESVTNVQARKLPEPPLATMIHSDTIQRRCAPR